MNRGKVRLDQRIDGKTALAIESEQHRLHQLLLRLKKEGKRSNSASVTEAQVVRLAIILGLEVLQALSFEAFESQCRSHGVEF
jgi:hypothetical protein